MRPRLCGSVVVSCVWLPSRRVYILTIPHFFASTAPRPSRFGTKCTYEKRKVQAAAKRATKRAATITQAAAARSEYVDAAEAGTAAPGPLQAPFAMRKPVARSQKVALRADFS